MSLSSFATLSRLGPTVTTGEAAAALNVSVSQASRLMRTLEAQDLARHVRYGLWVIGSDPVDARTLIEDVTRPYPAYLSFTSALNAHGMIDQVPREISVASPTARSGSRPPSARMRSITCRLRSLAGGWSVTASSWRGQRKPSLTWPISLRCTGAGRIGSPNWSCRRSSTGMSSTDGSHVSSRLACVRS